MPDNWYIHLRQLPGLDNEVLESLGQFVQSNKILAWIDTVMKPECTVESITPLHVAAWGGITNYLTRLLESGHDWNPETEHQENPLMMAARNGYANIVSILVDYGTPPDNPDIFGLKPLHYAAKSNYHLVVKGLLKVGVSPITIKTRDYPQSMVSTVSTVGQTPLEYACQEGCTESVHAMLPYLRETSLHAALLWTVKAGQLLLADCLLRMCDIELKGDIGGACLIAVAAGLVGFEMMQLLLNRGADPNFQLPLESSLLFDFQRHHIIGARGEIEHASVLLTLCAAQLKDKPHGLKTMQECVDLLIDAGCDVNIKAMDGKTALHYFVERSLPVGKLLKHGADVNATDNRGVMPIDLFLPSKSSVPILESLIQHGAKWDALWQPGKLTPLHRWVLSYRKDLDLECIKPYVKNWNIPGGGGRTPLHFAAGEKKHLSKQLIEMGADVNARDHNGEIPLHNLYTQSIDEELPLHLAAGADLEAKDNTGKTVFLKSVLSGSYHRFGGAPRKLVNLGANINATDNEGNGAIHLMCSHNATVSGLQFALEAGANPLHVNHAGDTPLHCLTRTCFRCTHPSIAKYIHLLLEAGVPIQARNYSGQTLLHCMCSTEPDKYVYGSAEPKVTDYFPESDVDAMMEAEDYQGLRPIHTAASVSEVIVAWLISRGANLSVLTHQRQNPLHIAASAKHANTIGLLLESYPYTERQNAVNQRDKSGQTPLHYACRSGRLESVELLVKAGAKPTLFDRNKNIPLHACAQFTRKPKSSFPLSGGSGSQRLQNLRIVWHDDETLRITEIIQLLQTYGADVLAQNIDGKTPLDVAVDNELEEMVVALSTGGADAGELLWMHRLDSSGYLVDKLLQENKTAYDLLISCERLLKIGAYRDIEELGKRVDLRDMVSNPKGDFLLTLARWGLTDLFERLGKRREDTSWINEPISTPADLEGNVYPFLFTVVSRTLPSLGLLRVIVETFKADVNTLADWEDYEGGVWGKQSALHILAKGKHWWQTEAMEYLLQQGANVELQDEDGNTPLQVAVQLGGSYRCFTNVRALLRHGANPNALSHRGLSPMNEASDNPQMVRLLIEHGADIHVGKEPILHRTIHFNEPDTVKVILEMGVDCNKPFREDFLPFKSTNRLWRDPWQELEDRENANLQKTLQCRPIHVACLPEYEGESFHQKNMDIIRLLLSHGANPFLPYEGTIIIHDILHHRGIYEPLLALPQLNLEQRDGRGRTLLLAACEGKEGEDQFRLIDRLCQMGADVSAVDSHGDNALHLIINGIEKTDQQQSADLLLSLIRRCASLLHRRNNQGCTPLHRAAQKHYVPALSKMCDAGADAFELDPDGNSPLHHIAACMAQGFPDAGVVFQHFLKLGLDINTRNKEGDVPIFTYIKSVNFSTSLHDQQNQAAIKLFSDYGADFLSSNNAGENLLHLIAKLPCEDEESQKHCEEWYRYFTDVGLDPFQAGCQHKTSVVVSTVRTGIKVFF